MRDEDVTPYLKDVVPSYQWSVFVDLSGEGEIKWTDGVGYPPDLGELQFLSHPPSVDPKGEDIGASVMCVAEDEVQVYVRCGNGHFLGVGAKRTQNVGLVRSMAVRAAQQFGG